MIINFFSFCMAIIWSSLFIISIYFFRKKIFAISFISVSGTILIYLICIVRITLPFETPYARIMISKNLYNGLMRLMNWGPGNGNLNFKIGSLLVGIWVIVSAGFFIHLLFIYYKFVMEIKRYEKVSSEELQNVLDAIICPRHHQPEILISSRIEIPMSFGVFKKYILLPNKEYGGKQLFYILMHEYTHFRNGDQIVKLLINFMQCIYWWNPFIHLLRRDLEQILEIKCDLTVIRGLNNNEKADYLDTIVSVIKDINTYFKKNPRNSNQLESYLFKKSSIGILERFQIVSKYENVANNKIMKIKLLAFMVLSLCLSYSFVIQSEFDVPMKEIETKEGAYNLNMSENYIFLDRHGNYLLRIPSQGSVVIDQQTAIKMIEAGFQIKTY